MDGPKPDVTPDDDHADVTPQGRPDFVALGLTSATPPPFPPQESAQRMAWPLWQSRYPSFTYFPAFSATPIYNFHTGGNQSVKTEPRPARLTTDETCIQKQKQSPSQWLIAIWKQLHFSLITREVT